MQSSALSGEGHMLRRESDDWEMKASVSRLCVSRPVWETGNRTQESMGMGSEWVVSRGEPATPVLAVLSVCI